ncbi:protein with putative role during mitosis [Nowakowskiella sp. JEL0078]|nr:protein with putative role during mitosis [Nowakowskiella sp. JEL0078]
MYLIAFRFRQLSILDYLTSNGFNLAATALKNECSLQELDFSKQSGLLERKWTSVVRLQKKTYIERLLDLIISIIFVIIELEQKLSTVQPQSNGTNGTSTSSGLPSAPEKYTLDGHRSPITSVAFHPTFLVLASGSEDSTIKIWDSETGEFERTLKGHTKSVLDVTFSPKGNLLGIFHKLSRLYKSFFIF